MSDAGASPNVPNITVEAIMTRSVHSISTEMTVRQAIQELLKRAISGAPIIDSQKKVISVASEGDLLKLAATLGLDRTIYQCMLKLTKAEDLVTLSRKDSFTEAYRKFLKHRVHRLIVVDEKGRLEGIVSRSNILRVLAEPPQAAEMQG